MNTRKAAPVIFTMSLVVLIGGGAGTAALGAPVRDDRSPTIVGFARGHVIVKDDLSPIRNAGGVLGITTSTPQGTQFSADVLRELHSRGPAPQSVPGFSAEVLRELKGSAPTVPQSTAADVQGRRLAAYADAAQATDETSVSEQGRRRSTSVDSGTSASEMQGKRLAAYADAVGAR